MSPIESTNELGRLYTAHLLLPQVKSAAVSEGIDALMLAFAYLLTLLAPSVTEPMHQLAPRTFRAVLFAMATTTCSFGLARGQSDMDNISVLCVL